MAKQPHALLDFSIRPIQDHICLVNSPLPAPVDFQESDLAGKRLLVVDDDEAMLRAVFKVLRHAGATVESAACVDEAVQMLSARAVSFDAVVKDLRMPGKGGVSTMKATDPDVPVRMMSAFRTREDRDECMELGASNFLDKPLRTWHLLSSVVKAIACSLRSGG